MFDFMNDNRFNIATEKANIVLKEMNHNNCDIVSTTEVVDIVGRLTGKKITILETDFSNLQDNAKNFGAMMCVTKDNATIVLNSNENIEPEFKRFSLVHELGHLITEKYNITANENQYTLSTHIDLKLNRIEEDEYKDNEFLINEEIANIFALKVLIPFNLLMKRIDEGKYDMKEISKSFGVSEDAIQSRLMLGA